VDEAMATKKNENIGMKKKMMELAFFKKDHIRYKSRPK